MLARVVEATERHYKAAGRRSGLPLPVGPIEDRDHFRIWPKVCSHSQPKDCTESMQPGTAGLPSICRQIVSKTDFKSLLFCNMHRQGVILRGRSCVAGGSCSA